MNVLSLFDGIACGRVALERAGIQVDNYYSSEIDKYAIKIAESNYPDIIQLGDVNNWRTWNLPDIDLIMGGSPCQGFSKAGKQLNFDDPRSQLFFKFVECLNYYKPKYFLLENVQMNRENLDIISSYLGVKPVLINSKIVCAQNRPRYYWTNINFDIPFERNIYLKDVLEKCVEDKYYVTPGRLKWLKEFGEVKEKKGYVAFNPDKEKCLTARSEPSWNTTYIVQLPRGKNDGGIKAQDGKTPTLTSGSWASNNYLVEPANQIDLQSGFVRKLTPIECERLQTLPDGYTNAVSDSQRYKLLGNGWTVKVITNIFKEISSE